MSQDREASGQSEAEIGATPAAQKPYEPPRVSEIGTLAELTGNVGAGFIDFPQGSSIAP